MQMQIYQIQRATQLDLLRRSRTTCSQYTRLYMYIYIYSCIYRIYRPTGTCSYVATCRSSSNVATEEGDSQRVDLATTRNSYQYVVHVHVNVDADSARPAMVWRGERRNISPRARNKSDLFDWHDPRSAAHYLFETAKTKKDRCTSTHHQ